MEDLELSMTLQLDSLKDHNSIILGSASSQSTYSGDIGRDTNLIHKSCNWELKNLDLEEEQMREQLGYLMNQQENDIYYSNEC